jgi:hypothetical protein
MFSWLWKRLWGTGTEAKKQESREESTTAAPSPCVKAPAFATPGPSTAISDEASSAASVSSLSPYPYLTPPDYGALSDAKHLFKVSLRFMPDSMQCTGSWRESTLVEPWTHLHGRRPSCSCAEADMAMLACITSHVVVPCFNMSLTI